MPKKQVDQVTLNKRVKMKIGGMTYKEIAEIEGVTKQAICKQISNLIPNKSALDTYKQNRADILAGKQIEILQALTPDKIKDASALQLVTSMGILTDKERLERGQSTQNIESVVTEMHGELAKLIKLRASIAGENDDDAGKG